MANVTSAAPVIAKEIGKKKRVNRSAKLKQCKLDARREQWLSHVKNKECKDTTMATSPTSPPQRISKGRSAEKACQYHQAVATSPEHDGSSLQDCSDADSLTRSPVHHPNGNPSSIGSCSGSISDDENDKEEAEEKGGGGLDDWEAIADALSMSPDNAHDHHHATTEMVRDPEPIKQEPERTIPRAWRADDVFRPQSLPNLSKQWSFPINTGRHYDAHLSPPPSSCPICYEDLDLTDSSFLPCSCGFRLCLFCHKRILEADGRCPGCRKQYGPLTGCETADIITEACVPPLSYRFSRSYSMSLRS